MSSSNMINTFSSPALFGLPRELRNRIYSFIANGEQANAREWTGHESNTCLILDKITPPVLSQSCRQLRLEYLPFFFGNNIFRIDAKCEPPHVTDDDIESIPSMSVDYGYGYDSDYEDDMAYDAETDTFTWDQLIDERRSRPYASFRDWIIDVSSLYNIDIRFRHLLYRPIKHLQGDAIWHEDFLRPHNDTTVVSQPDDQPLYHPGTDISITFPLGFTMAIDYQPHERSYTVTISADVDIHGGQKSFHVMLEEHNAFLAVIAPQRAIAALRDRCECNEGEVLDVDFLDQVERSFGSEADAEMPSFVLWRSWVQRMQEGVREVVTLR